MSAVFRRVDTLGDHEIVKDAELSSRLRVRLPAGLGFPPSCSGRFGCCLRSLWTLSLCVVSVRCHCFDERPASLTSAVQGKLFPIDVNPTGTSLPATTSSLPKWLAQRRQRDQAGAFQFVVVDPMEDVTSSLPDTSASGSRYDELMRRYQLGDEVGMF